jgi:hypothetical protein
MDGALFLGQHSRISHARHSDAKTRALITDRPIAGLKILECDLRAFGEPVGQTIRAEAVANPNSVSKMISNVETHSWNVPSDAPAASQYQNLNVT